MALYSRVARGRCPSPLFKLFFTLAIGVLALFHPNSTVISIPLATDEVEDGTTEDGGYQRNIEVDHDNHGKLGLRSRFVIPSPTNNEISITRGQGRNEDEDDGNPTNELYRLRRALH